MNPVSIFHNIERLPFVRDRILPLIASPTRRRLANGAFWSAFTLVITRFISLVSSIVVARILGREAFGEYGMLNSTAATAGGIAGLGIGCTIVKYVAEFKYKDKEKAGRIIALSLAITVFSAISYAIIFIVFSKWLAEKALAAPHFTFLLKVSSLTVAFGIVNGVQTSSLTGCEAFKSLSIINISQSILQATMVIFGVWLWGVSGGIWMLGGATMIVVFLTRKLVAREWQKLGVNLNWKHMFEEKHVFFNFSIPACLSGVSSSLSLWACAALLANQTNGYSHLGVYNAANQWQSVIQFLPAVVCPALMPILSEKYGNGGKHNCFQLTKKMTIALASVVIPIVLIVSLVSPLIMRSYGGAFASGYWVLCVSCLSGALLAIMTPAGHLIEAAGKMWMSFFLNIAWGAVLMLLSVYLVRWNAIGLAFARLGASVFHIIWMLIFVTLFVKEHKRALDT